MDLEDGCSMGKWDFSRKFEQLIVVALCVLRFGWHGMATEAGWRSFGRVFCTTRVVKVMKEHCTGSSLFASQSSQAVLFSFFFPVTLCSTCYLCWDS